MFFFCVNVLAVGSSLNDDNEENHDAANSEGPTEVKCPSKNGGQYRSKNGTQSKGTSVYGAQVVLQTIGLLGGEMFTLVFKKLIQCWHTVVVDECTSYASNQNSNADYPHFVRQERHWSAD